MTESKRKDKMKEGLHIVGMGHYVPEHVVTNDDLSKIVDTNDEWISSRTGIRRRHFITDEKNQDMAIAAAKMAIEDAGIDKSEIGVVIVATIRPDHMTPSVACMVQKELELPQDIPCFDINAACSGFMYGVQIARGMLLQSDKKYGVVIGSETLSKILDMNDRSTCILFGDGAGAAVVELSDTQWNRKQARLAVATSRDLQIWEKYGPAFAKAYGGRFFDEFSKSASIVTKLVDGKQVIAKIDGKYWMYWGQGKYHV